MINKISLVIKNGFVAYHYWKNAPKEVKFLRNPHRHIFLVATQIPVTKEDRKLEFFIIQRSIAKYLRANFSEKTFSYSCEKFASLIKVYLDKKYKTNCSVGVFEDGENGAVVE